MREMISYFSKYSVKLPAEWMKLPIAPRARGQDEEILRCDWLPEWARWSYLISARDYPVRPARKIFPKAIS